MKYWKEYGKLFRSKEYRAKKNLNVGSTVVFFLFGIVLECFLANAGGRKVLYVAYLYFIIFAALTLLVLGFIGVREIIKDFRTFKKEFRLLEEGKKQKEEKPEKQAKTAMEAFAPTYFLDLSALEHVSGDFYPSFLMETFQYDFLTSEANAVFMTDKKTLEALKEKEASKEDKKIYLGYVAFISRNFQILPPMEDLVEGLAELVETKMPYLVLVTADDERARRMKERVSMQIRNL